MAANVDVDAALSSPDRDGLGRRADRKSRARIRHRRRHAAQPVVPGRRVGAARRRGRSAGLAAAARASRLPGAEMFDRVGLRRAPGGARVADRRSRWTRSRAMRWCSSTARTTCRITRASRSPATSRSRTRGSWSKRSWRVEESRHAAAAPSRIRRRADAEDLFHHRPNSVQTTLLVGRAVDPRTNPDYDVLNVANRVLAAPMAGCSVTCARRRATPTAIGTGFSAPRHIAASGADRPPSAPT